jgi:hypothetical protein
VEHGVDKQTVVRGGHANRTGPSRQQVLDPVPLVIAERCIGASVSLSKADRL